MEKKKNADRKDKKKIPWQKPTLESYDVPKEIEGQYCRADCCAPRGRGAQP